MDPTSSQAFFKKLTEKEREKTYQLYESRGKENLNRQAASTTKCKKEKVNRTQSSIIFPDRKIEKHWYLDNRDCSKKESNGPRAVDHWLCLGKGTVQFAKIIKHPTEFEEELNRVLDEKQLVIGKGEEKSIAIHIWSTTPKVSLVNLLMDYSLPLLAYGKGSWSLTALTANKKFDLLSLDAQGSILWKSQTPLAKVLLEKQKLMRRVFGFSCEKENDIGKCEILAKLQLPNNSIIYFIVRDASYAGLPSSAQLMIEQQAIFQNIKNLYTFSILRTNSELFQDQEQAEQILGRFNLKVKQEEDMERNQRQQYLKSMIQQLKGELIGKQQELKQYKEQQQVVLQEIGIPSERISMGQERYMHLRRRIKENKNL